MKFKEYKNLDLNKVAEENLAYWKANEVFKKSVANREGSSTFVFYEGPPSANGLPGIHHVMARTIKDIFCRYKTQKGFQVKRKAGWDTHGLPVELGVEKELGITKVDIGTKISLEEYSEACKKAVMKYTDIWNDLTEKMGYWVDMDNPYVTYDSKYMESVWWLLKRIYDKGYLYKGYTVQPYSPKAGTGLSSHELNQPGCYKDISDTTVVAQFKAKQDTLPEHLKAFKNLYMLAWTTTPWTLPSNTALCVNPNIDYVVIKTYNQYTFALIEVLLAKDLVSKQFSGKYIEVKDPSALNSYQKEDKKIPYCTTTQLKGKDLEGIRYEQLLDYVQPYENPENAFRVITGDFVTTEEGTGIVHIAPTFGADDANVAKQAIPPVPAMLILNEEQTAVPIVNLQGKFRKEIGNLAGQYVRNEYYDEEKTPEKSVDIQIAINLKEKNRAFKVEKYSHSYPHCWRTDKPILYYPLDSWFIKVTAIKDKLITLNNTINWKPKSTGEKRFGNWLKNANDWNLSRSRFWGIPLPIWRTEDKTEELVIGSVEELKTEINKSVEAGFMSFNPLETFVAADMSKENYEKIDLHKKIVDDIVLVSSKGGLAMKRETDLIDVWFDSGSMPFAQWHYPFEMSDKKEFDKVFPADFIAEGVDQTRGWFYTLHVIAAMITDNVAYKNVVSNGLVLDKEGQKMSKRLNNTADPFKTLQTYGPDATRWYMISNSNPWDSLKFDLEGVAEVSRRFFGTLYNTYSFFSLYANIDGFTYKEKDIPFKERAELDQWILSELHSLIEKVDRYYNNYEATKVARAISYFVQEHLSNWYIRLSRRRFWKGEYLKDKISAYQTLYSCMINVAKLSAPIAPFYMDTLYKDLVEITKKEKKESVHLSNFPIVDTFFIDESLQNQMTMAQNISSLILSLRKKENIKVRQPLSKVLVSVLNERQKESLLAASELIKAEVNVKEIQFLDEDSDMIQKKIKPNFKILGPKFGAQIKLISNGITKLNQQDIKKIEQEGKINININNNNIYLHREEVEILSKDIEGYLVASNTEVTVALDITIDEKLKYEGVVRELINRIQNLRKKMNFEVTDKINATIQNNTEIQQAILFDKNEEYLKNETLMNVLSFSSKLKNAENIGYDGMDIWINCKKTL